MEQTECEIVHPESPRLLKMVRFNPMVLFFGQSTIPFIQDFLLFFQSTGTSNARFKGTFRGTWLPSFGLRRDMYLIKMVDYAENSNFNGRVRWSRLWPSNYLQLVSLHSFKLFI